MVLSSITSAGAVPTGSIVNSASGSPFISSAPRFLSLISSILGGSSTTSSAFATTGFTNFTTSSRGGGGGGGGKFSGITSSLGGGGGKLTVVILVSNTTFSVCLSGTSLASIGILTKKANKAAPIASALIVVLGLSLRS